MSRVLTVDIGNSNIVVGSWNSDELEFSDRIVTKRNYAQDELFSLLNNVVLNNKCTARSHADSDEVYDGAILSSVVPEITEITLDALEKIIAKRPLLMGPFLRTGVDISGYKQGAIGMDRVVDMAAALSMYGKQVVVCDLGTCTTITAASDKIIGGMICPGIQLSLDAEASRASQLPQLSASEVRTLLGNDTASNMISGVVAGTGMMISELAKRLRMGAMTLDFTEDKNVAKEMPDLKVVVTGGLGRLVLPWIKQGLPPEIEAYYDENLLIRGLKEIYFLNT